jgi:pyruvate dehydrogenase E2 component (dihydrolipoamide acetyltransferase)
MATEIVLMPDADGSGDVIEFCLQIGDQVSVGDPMLVIESDKASMEIPSSVAGTVVEWLVKMGDSIETDRPLAKVEVSGALALPEVVSVQVVEDVEIQQPVAEKMPLSDNLDSNRAAMLFEPVEELMLMPDTGGKGDIIEFYVQPGDSIEEGDLLALVESDKAAMDIPAPFGGMVIELVAQLGQTVEEGVPLVKVLRARSIDLTVADAETAHAVEPIGQVESTSKAATMASAVVAAPTHMPTFQVQSPAVASDYYAGPATRKLARDLGVDLSRVAGSGKRARILKEDVKQFVKTQMSQAARQPDFVQSGIPAMPEVDFSKFGSVDASNLSGIAKATSAHMTRCWLNIPHVTLFDEVDITDLEAFRAAIKPEVYGLEKKPTLLPFIIMIVAKALRKYPQFNSSLHADGEQIIYKDYVHIGVAVDTPAGLVVPVLRDADKMSISEITKLLAELAEKAQRRKLKAEDMQGGCFTVSSLGASGGIGFTPIINGPEVAILGVARSDIKPVWNGEMFIPRKQLPLCLSFDHRVVNGGDAGRFMAMLHQCLSQIGNTLL